MTITTIGRSILKVVFIRLIPAIVLLLAIFLGWCNLESPAVPWEGRLFVFLIPLLKGYAPPIIVGHGKLGQAKETPPVPTDMIPQARPPQELTISLAGTGDKMPQAGIGMCCRPTAYDHVSVERSIEWYLLLGGRHIDGAHLYLNHEAIGRGIANAIAKGVPRKEIFFTTKVWPTHFGYNTTKELVSTTFLKNELKPLDGYLNMVLMHAPVRGSSMFLPAECKQKGLTYKECRQETWKALSELRAEGLIRNVGVSNFAIHHLNDIIELYDDDDNNNIAPIANNQIQWNPWAPIEWVDTVRFCQDNNIAITAYNSLGGSLEHHQVHTIDILNTLASKYDRSVAQIMLRWAIQSGAAIIPGTGNPKYMKENLVSIYEFELSKQDMADIEGLRDSADAQKFTAMKPLE